MSPVRGHFQQGVIVLDEPVVLEDGAQVIVHVIGAAPSAPSARRFHWEESRTLVDSLRGSVSDELRRQRDEA
jgi:hypothetical protein